MPKAEPSVAAAGLANLPQDGEPAPLPPDATLAETRAQWRAWLAAHHQQPTGVWLATWKKASGHPHLGYDAIVEEALCFGWVDSKTRALDALRSMLWVAPRKPGTGWSATNKARIERLLAAGQMAPAGLAKVQRAQSEGSWALLDAVEALAVPDDLATALAGYADAARYFDGFPRSVKRAILEWITIAKKPETRAARIAEAARLAQTNQRANQWRGQSGRTPRTLAKD